METCLRIKDRTYGHDQLTESASAYAGGAMAMAVANVQILEHVSLGALLYYVMFEADQHADFVSFLQSDHATSKLTADSQIREEKINDEA